MRAIQLSKILRDAVHPVASNVVHGDFTDTDDVGENQHTAVAAPVATPALTVPVLVNVECIRCMTPRRENRGVGARLTFIDGGGFAVAETYEQICDLIRTAGHTIHVPAGGEASAATATH